jgi:hypothetical protein
MSVLNPKSWAEYEADRQGLGLSRAELLRRAGISETTMFKGLKAHAEWEQLEKAGDRKAIRRGAPKPQQHLQSKLDRVLDLERAMARTRIEADRHMREAGLR